MTQQEQVHAVLEKMGWKRRAEIRSDYWLDPDEFVADAPDLLHDLNAIALARGTLLPNEQCDYTHICCEMVRREENITFREDPKKVFPFNCFRYFALLNLTPAQHLEAICRTWWPKRFTS